MTQSLGLKFEKFDLHVHTPASFDFSDKTITSEDIIKEAKRKGLKGIAITDHNTGEWVDKMKMAAKGHDLIIFPGVEIYCTGGGSGIHVIAILDFDKGTKHIEAILAKLEIDPTDYGKKATVTRKSVFDVIDAITSDPINGIAVLAHCTSSKGVLSDIKGETRTEIFKHPKLLAVESSYHDFTDSNKISKKTRAIDLLNGNDSNYAERKLGVYIASDSHEEGKEGHTLAGIGSNYTYFKVDDIVNLESLRQCFIDREVRIKQFFEKTETKYPQIKKVKISGGFFDNQEANFHTGLNSILGSKGSGKSLLIELLRFSTDKIPSQPEIHKDHVGKMNKRLLTYGKVEVTIIDETGQEHVIERTYNPIENSPYKTSDQKNIANSFKAIFLSQNEIIKIAEDENEQIKFIDSFFDFQYYKNKINNTEKDISIFDETLADGLKAYSEVFEIQKQLDTLVNEKTKLDSLLSDKIYDDFKKLEDKNRAIVNQDLYMSELILELEQYKEDIIKKESPEIINAELVDDPIIKRNNDTIIEAINVFKELIEQSIEKAKQFRSKLLAEKETWDKKFLTDKTKYEDHIRTTGGDRKTQEAKRIKIINEITELTKRISLLNKKKENLKNIISQRDSKIEELFSVYRDYSKERISKCEKFEKESNGKLQIKIQEATNFDDFKNSLLQLKRGSYIQNSDIDQLCSTISPKEFIGHLFNYEVSKQAERLQPITDSTLISIEKVKILCDFLLSQVDYSSLLKLQYKAKPQDRPEIRYKVNKTDYELIKDLSVGQKCTAMLIMTLSDGIFPVIIDQPEDSLDVRSIWEDMCLKIRKGKENRQFMFTTHNSSLAVASDTDLFLIIESDSSSGKIVNTGALESSHIKENVITYLEGGRPTYSHKANTYDINK